MTPTRSLKQESLNACAHFSKHYVYLSTTFCICVCLEIEMDRVSQTCGAVSHLFQCSPQVFNHISHGLYLQVLLCPMLL